jgi:membrane associated rhomboid family serine protease
VRDRLIVALADPEIASKAGRTPATLIAFQGPMIVFEWLGTGKGLVFLDDQGLSTEELSTQLDRVLQAHERGLLFIAVASSNKDIVQALHAADAKNRKSDHIGLYHMDDAGKVNRVAGRRLAELEKAGRALPATAPLSPEDVAAIIERGRKERQEAMDFVRGTARHFPHLTVALIVLCVLIYALSAGNDPRAQQLYQLFCNDPIAVREGEVWRLFTYALLHDKRTLTHLIVNMLSLYSLGAFLEPLLGRAKLGLLCIVTAFVGGLASTVFLQLPSVGASGMVWGLVGATFGFLSGRHSMFPALIARSLRRRLIVILAINIAISFLPGIDRYAHFGGGLAGYVLSILLAKSPAKQS